MLSQSGAILFQRHQRVVRAVLLDDLFLLLSQLGQEHHLLLVRTTPKGDVDDHIHGRIPATRVNRDELSTKTDDLGLILVHRDQFKEPLKAPFKAIGKDTGDHLNAVLRSRQLSLNSRTGRGLEDISIKALRGTRDSCPLGLDLVHVGHDAKRLCANKRGREGHDSPRRSHTDQSTRLIVHEIVNVDRLFCYFGYLVYEVVCDF